MGGGFGKISPNVMCLFVTIPSLLSDMSSTGGELNWKWGISTPSVHLILLKVTLVRINGMELGMWPQYDLLAKSLDEMMR